MNGTGSRRLQSLAFDDNLIVEELIACDHNPFQTFAVALSPLLPQNSGR